MFGQIQNLEDVYRKRDAILDVARIATEQYLSSSAWEDSIQYVLKLLGQTTHSSRVYVFAKHTEQYGQHLANQRYEWSAPGIPPRQTGSLDQTVFEDPMVIATWEAILSKRQIVQGNAEDFPSIERAFLQRQGAQSFIGIPIFVDDRWWGFVGLENNQKDRFWSSAEVDALKIVANLLGAIMQRKRSEEVIRRLYESEREQRLISQALREAGLKMSSTLVEEEILDLLLEQVQRVVPFDTGVVMIVKDSQAVMARLRGYEQFGEEICQRVKTLEFSIAELRNLRQMIETHRPVVVADTLSEPDWKQLDETQHIRSWIGAPIVVQGKVVAFLSLDKMEANFYRPEHAEVLVAFANQAALALHNARLFAETERALRREERLNELTRLINSQMSISTILQNLVQQVSILLDSDSATIGIVKRDSDEMVFAYRFNPPQNSPQTLKRGQGLSWLVYESGQSLMIADYSVHPRAVDEWKLAGVTSYLAVPLTAGGEKLGVLSAFNIKKDKFFTGRELHLAESIGRQAGIAICNARLFEMLQRRAEESETLRQASISIVSSLKLDEVLNTILEQLQHVVPYDSASIFLLEAQGMRMVAARGEFAGELVGKVFPERDELFFEAARTGKPVILRDASQDSRFHGWGGVSYVRGWVGVPLLLRSEAIGCLTLDSRQVGAYDHINIPLLQTFANEAAVAIHNAQLLAQVEQLAIVDPLTGLYNRRYFMEIGQREFRRARRQALPLSIVVADIDNFRVWNDEYGHLLGDRLLRVLSEGMRGVVREADILARTGGDEFAVLLPQTSLGEAVELAERLSRVAKESLVVIPAKTAITLSFGLADIEGECSGFEDLYRRAEKALLNTGKTGVNRISLWDITMEEKGV